MTSPCRRQAASLSLFVLILVVQSACAQRVSPPASQTEIAREAVAASPVEDLGTRAGGVDWPTFLGPTGDGKSPETGLNFDWNDRPPPVAWDVEVGEGYGPPAISHGRLFLFDRIGDEERLRCLHSETGRELWEFRYDCDYVDLYGYDGGPRSAPVVDGDRVYTYGVQGVLHCLSVVDGAKRWRVDASIDYGVVQNFFGVGGAPLVEGELVIAQVGGSPPNSPPIHSGEVEGNGSAVVAFDKHTGREAYRLSDELASYSSPVAATIGGRRWGFLFTRGGLLGFDPLAGTEDFFFPWRSTKLESVNAANPVVVGDEVFISEAYDADFGSALLRPKPGGYDVVWRDPPRSRSKSMQCHFQTPIYLDGRLYGSSARHSPDAELRCIEWSTGKVLWSEPGLGWTGLLYVDGRFVALSEDGILRVVSARDSGYEELAKLVIRDAATGLPQIRRPAWAAPVLSHGLLYLHGRGRLVCLDLTAP